jgi:FHA domain/Double zinc ribbon
VELDTRFYQSQTLDIERIGFELENMFLTQGYQVQHFGDKEHIVVQFKKGGDFAAIVGMQAALTLTLHSSPGGVMAVVGQQRWADKAAAGTVGMLILWPLAFTAGAGMIRQSNLTNQVLNSLDIVVRQQQANIQVGPVPAHLLQQMQTQSTPAQPMPAAPPPPPSPRSYAATPPPPPRYAPRPPAPQKINCPNCQAANDLENLYCARCGKSLVTPPKVTCPQCGAQIKPDAVFCTRCGHSFSSQSAITDATVVADMTPQTQRATPVDTTGYLVAADGQQVILTGSQMTIGRVAPETAENKPDINLYAWPDSGTVSRLHATIDYTNNQYMLTDLKSTNRTLINDQILAPDVPKALTDGDNIHFGKVIATFHQA